MRILVYGAGVLGCNLACSLNGSHKDVTILARNKWADEIEANGIHIKNKLGFTTKNYRVNVIRELKQDDVYDVIFVTMRYTQLDSVIDSLKKNDSKNIVFVGNNVNAQHYIDELENKNVMFAFFLTAGHREKDKVVSICLNKITIGQTIKQKSNEEFIKQIFEETKLKVVYEPYMEDYLLCHAAYVVPITFACYKSNGDLKTIKNDTAYLNKLIDANIEGYEAIEKAGYKIKPDSDANYHSKKYRDFNLKFLKLMCATCLGKICASDHAYNAIDEMKALNEGMIKFFDEHDAKYPTWKELEVVMDKLKS